GMPIAMNFMRRYAVRIKKDMNNGLFVPAEATEKITEKSNEKAGPLKSSMTLKLFFVFVGAAVGVMLGELTGIHFTLWCLAIGVVGLKLGLFEEKSLEKANSFTITMIAIIFVVIGTMADVSPQEALSNLPGVALILILGTIGLSIGG